MLENYQNLLMAEKEKMREKENLRLELEAAALQLEKITINEQRFKRKLDKEKVDVDKLEGISIKGLFIALAGKKDEVLDREKQELLEAQLKWKEARSARRELELEYRTLQTRIDELGFPEDAYNRLLEQKQQFLVRNGYQEGERVLQISETIAELRADSKEIHEALEAGRHASKALAKAEDALDSAKNWGTLDMFGGGIISTAIKHSRVDEAGEEVHQAQRLLRKYSHELNDIGETFTLDVSISGGWSVADYFLDGLITDWFVQGKINDSANQVRSVKNETDRSLIKLEELSAEVDQKIKELESDKKSLLESIT
ncbi:hypothetical protein [Sediminibacillus albus]|uniref:Uncharacterized protein n=1 Tax=Sediminibacillus albus TaxID=407036 RepID=A0A1G8XBY2_9BACI|nr:hypothetical protein [Sediminibacillus albus]SDJ88179.1 hypothetical protein SAMN05216243_1284 [Sediminibacillus albus]